MNSNVSSSDIIAYTSDMKFVEECLLGATDLDFKKHYPELTGELADEWSWNRWIQQLNEIVSYRVP